MLVQMPLWCAIIGGLFAFIGALAVGVAIYTYYGEKGKKGK